MASWLVLDWDHEQFHVALAQSTRRGVEITRAVTWAHPEPFTPSTAARLGKALREFLNSEKLAAAPVIVGLGRDRIFLKELRFPSIAAHEEASLVRFQTGKEMAESVESYAIDYVPLPNGSSERHVMAVAARRDFITMLKTLCDAAGLKLQAITPKLFAMPLAMERALRPDPAPTSPRQLNVVLNIGSRWAELGIFKGDRLLQAQALANGPLLAGEIKRSLAVFQAQSAVNIDLSGPECLYVFGEDKAAIENLQMGLSLPLRQLDPLKPEGDLSESPSHFAGAAGLAELWNRPGEKPINLATPRKAEAPVSVTRQRGMLYGAVAAVALVVLVGMAWWVLSGKKAEIARLVSDKLDMERQLTQFAQERAEADAFKAWEQGKISVLDEIYDLTARFPAKEGFRVNMLIYSAGSGTAKKGPKQTNYPGLLKVSGVGPLGKDTLIDNLETPMLTDSHIKATRGKTTYGKASFDYQLNIDIARQDARKYDTKLSTWQRPEIRKKRIEIIPDDTPPDTPPDDEKMEKMNPDDGGVR